MFYEGIVDQLSAFYTSEQYRKEVQDAKREFFENAGVLEEDSDIYDLRMSQFLDWYLFSRDLADNQVPPVVDAFRYNRLDFEEQELPQVQNLVNHVHSLFDLIKIKNDVVFVKDLFENKKYQVKNAHFLLGHERYSIFEARLIPDGENFYFTRGICFHPADARKFLLAEVKKCRDSELQHRRLLMLKLMKMRYKFELYRNVSIKQIYTEQSMYSV